MDYQQEVKEILSDYTCLEAYIDSLEEELKHDEPCIHASWYEKGAPAPSDDPDPVQIEREKKWIRREIKINKAVVTRVDRSMDALRDRQRGIVDCRYIQGMSLEEVATTTGYSVSQCKRLCKSAIYKMSVAMFGVRARRNGRKEERA